MALRYYDDVLTERLKRWVPENSHLRILKPDESKRLFELIANDNNDKNIKVPFIALSRDTSIEINSNIKQNKSFDGLKLANNDDITLQLNVIPVTLNYQLDIYTKTYDDGDEYLRSFLFKLINNPLLKIEIPYNNTSIQHVANIRVADQVSDTSDISERMFSGQFTRWTIQLELQDAFLFSIPYRKNWKLDGVTVEVSDKITEPGEIIETIANKTE